MNPDASKGESQLPNALDQRSLQGATMPPEQATQAQNIQMPGGPNLAQPQGAQMHGVQLQGVQEQGMPGVAMPNLADGQSMQGAASNTAMPGQNAQQSVMGQSAMGQPVMGQPAMNPQGINQPVANMSMANRALDPQMVAHMQQQERIRKQGNRKKFKKVVLVMLLVLILAAAVAGGVWALMTQPWKSDSKTSNDDTSANVEDKDQSSGQDVPGGQVANDPDCATEVAYIPEFVTEELQAEYLRELDDAIARYEKQIVSMETSAEGSAEELTAMREGMALMRKRREEATDYEQFRNTYAIKRTKGRAICLAWGVKINIPSEFESVDYTDNNYDGEYKGTFHIYGVTKNGKNYNLRNYGVPDMMNVGLGLVEWVALSQLGDDAPKKENDSDYGYQYSGSHESWMQDVHYDNGEFGMLNNDTTHKWTRDILESVDASEEDIAEMSEIVNGIQQMLTNRENYSAL